MPFDDFLRQNYPQLGGNLTQTPVPGMTAPIQFTPMPNTQPGSAAATQVQQQNQAVLYQQEVNRRNAEVAARQEQEQQRIAAEQEGRGGGFFQPVRAVIDAVADYPRNIANAVSNLGHDRNFLSPAAWGGAALTAASPAFALGDMANAYWKEARGEILYRVAAGDNGFFDALGMLMPMGSGITLKGIYMGLDAGLSDEAKRGIMDAHDNGYKGFTGGTAVYEMAMGTTDDWHPIAKYSFRIVNEVINDPMTWVGVGAAARLSSVGKLGAIGRSEEAFGALGPLGKAKAIASDVRQLKDPLVAVDTAMRGVNYVPDQVMFGLPGKAIRAADTATGGHLFRQSGQAARRHIEAQEQETLADFARTTEPTTMPTDPGVVTLPGGQQVPDVEPGDPVRGTYLLPTGEGEAPPPIPGFDTTIDMAPERKVRVRYTLRDQQTGDPSFIDILDDGTYRVMPAGENTWHPVSTLDTAFDRVASTVPNPPPTQRSPVGPNPTYERQQRYAAEGGIPTDIRPQRDITVRGTTDGQSAVWEVNHRGKNRSLYIRRQPNGYFRISDEAGSMIPGPEYTKYGDAYEAATSYLLQQPYRYQVDPYGRPLHPAAVPRPDGGRVIDEAYRLTQENPGVPQWIWFWRRYKEIEQQYAPVIDREQGMIDKTTGLKRDLPAGDPDALERGLTVDTYVKTLAEANIAFYSDYLSMIVNNGERVAQTQRGWRGTPSEQIAAFMFGPGKKRGDVFQSDLNRAEAIREAILTDDEEASRIIIDYFRRKRRVMLSEEQAKSVLLPGAQLRPGAKRKEGYVNLANVLEANRSRRREMFLTPEEPPLMALPQGDIPGPRMVPADPLVTPPPGSDPFAPEGWTGPDGGEYLLEPVDATRWRLYGPDGNVIRTAPKADLTAEMRSMGLTADRVDSPVSEMMSRPMDGSGLYPPATPDGLEMRPAPSGMTGEVPANLDLVRDQLADVEIRHANIPTDDPRYNGVLEAVSTAREDLNTVLASRRKGSSREMRGAAFARAQYYLQEADRLEGLIADPSQIVTPPPTRLVERDVLVRPPRVPRLETVPVEQEPLGMSRPADFTVPPPVAEQPGLSTPPKLTKSMLRGERAPAAPRPPRQAAPAPAPAPEPLLPVREAAPSNDDLEFGDLGLPAPDLGTHRRRMNEIAGKTERFASAEKVNPNLTPEQVSGFKAAARLTLRQSEEIDRLAREIETARAALLKIKDPAQRDQAWTRILNMKDEYDELAGTNNLADIKAILERTPVRQDAPATPARQAPSPAPAAQGPTPLSAIPGARQIKELKDEAIREAENRSTGAMRLQQSLDRMLGLLDEFGSRRDGRPITRADLEPSRQVEFDRIKSQLDWENEAIFLQRRLGMALDELRSAVSKSDREYWWERYLATEDKIAEFMSQTERNAFDPKAWSSVVTTTRTPSKAQTLAPGTASANIKRAMIQTKPEGWRRGDPYDLFAHGPNDENINIRYGDDGTGEKVFQIEITDDTGDLLIDDVTATEEQALGVVEYWLNEQPSRQAPEPTPASITDEPALPSLEGPPPLATDAQAFTTTTGEPAPPLNRFQKAGQTRRMNRMAAEPGVNVGAEEFSQTTRRPVGARMPIPGLSRRQLVEEPLEPPVPEGYTRLYRVVGQGVSDWAAASRVNGEAGPWEGRWFASDPEISAGYYRDAGGMGKAKVTYLDVPSDQVEQYRVSNLRDNAVDKPNIYSLDPENEFFVSPEMAASAQEIPGLATMTAARRQEMHWPTPNEPLITVDEETGRFPWDPEPERPMVEVTGAEPPPDITLMADTPLVKRVKTRPQGSPNRAEEMWGQVLTGDEDEASSALDTLVYDITGGQVQRDAPSVDESASGGIVYTIRDEADGIPSVQIRKGDVPIRENGEVVGSRPGLYLIAPGGSDDPVVKNIIARAGDGVPVEVVRGGGDMLGTPMGLTGPSEMGLPDPLWDPVYRMWRMAQIDDTERELLEEILPISGGKNAKTMRLADLYLLNRSQSESMNEAIEKTMRTFRKHRNAANRNAKEASGQYAKLRKVLRVYDTLTDNIRERLMFNPYTGAVSAMLDHVGDTARLLSVGEFRAARNAWKLGRAYVNDKGEKVRVPSTWRAGMMAAQGDNSWLMATDAMKVAAKLGMDAPTELAPSLGREGLDRTRGLSFDRMIEGFTENQSGQRKLKRILAAAGFRGSDFILELRSGGDIARRSSLFGEEIARQLPKYRDEFFDEVDRVAARRPGFDAEGFKRALGEAFSPTDVRLLSMDHGLDVGQAEHLMRNWKSKHKPLREAGLAKSKEVLFSYDQTNIDQVLRRVFLFHYWYTRASVAYTRTILKNPYLYTNYMRMTEGLEKMAEDQPSSVKGMIKAFTGPGGYAIFMDPLKVVSTAVTFRRQAFQDGDDTAFDQFLDTTGLFLNPMIAAASAVLGATSNERVDPLATFQIRRVGGAAINAINAETGMFGGSYLGTPFQDKMGKAVQELSDIFGEPNYARDTAATEKVLIRTGIMDRVMARHGIEQGTEFGLWPSQAMMELQEALDAFDTGRPNPDADAAYRDWARGNLVRQTASLVAPVGVSMRSNSRDARTSAARMTGTDRYDAELDITAAAPEATDLTIQRARFDSLFPSNEMGRVTESPLTGQTQAEVLAEPGMSDYTQYRDWRNAARDMGTNAFRERMRRISPSYAAYIESQEAELGDVFAEDPDYYDNISTSYQAFLAAQGERASAYDPASPPSLDMSSVNASTFVTGGYGGGTPPLQEEDLGSRITGQLIGYHQQQQEFNRLVQQYFGQEVVFDLLSPQGQAFIRQQLGPMGIRLPSLGEEAAGYQAWSRVQPMGSDTSIAAYVRWLETRAASGLNTRAVPMMANM